MEDRDRKFLDLGFKCGLEIHQQLLTQKKLFCHCPAGYRNDKPEAEIVRHMRPTLSELGEYDGTALMEFKTKKNVIYQLYRDNCCTYEMDDTPPFPINREALEVAIKLALMLNCAIVDELHVSRKQYLDGSIPTGFQRTAIVGVNGWVPYKGRKITITHVCLEEDACREISDIGHDIVFRTDRLSMPLLEVITAPDMKTPREAMEVNALIGRVLKASRLVRRGIGSVRQDVNVSITGGNRVEIKGVPQTWMVEKLTAIEAERQAGLLAIRDTLKSRGITFEKVQATEFEASGILKNFGIPIIDKALALGWSIKGIKLTGFSGIIGSPLQPQMTFADELSGRVKVIACLDSMPNIAVSDLPQMAGFNKEIWQAVCDKLGTEKGDALIITWGPEADVATALSEIVIRAKEATLGVPNETRQAFPGGVTGFERILPGPDRMYPDTDSPPVEIKTEWLDKLKTTLPIPAYITEEKWAKSGVPPAIIAKAVVSPFAYIFDRLIELGVEPQFAWVALKAFKYDGQAINQSFIGELEQAFTAYRERKISKESLYEILRLLSDGKIESVKQAIDDRSIIEIGDKRVVDEIKAIIEKTANGNFKNQQCRIGYIISLLRGKFQNRLDYSKLSSQIAMLIS